jgi:hypothetical protein
MYLEDLLQYMKNQMPIKDIDYQNHLYTFTSLASKLIPNSFEYLLPTLHINIFVTYIYQK